MCIGGSFCGGNMFQANQSYAAIAEILLFELNVILYGAILATFGWHCYHRWYQIIGR